MGERVGRWEGRDVGGVDGCRLGFSVGRPMGRRDGCEDGLREG